MACFYGGEGGQPLVPQQLNSVIVNIDTSNFCFFVVVEYSSVVVVIIIAVVVVLCCCATAIIVKFWI